MKGKNAYRDWLKQDLGSLIDALKLSDLQKHFLRSRWLEQVLWMEDKADTCQFRYYALRLLAIVGGVIIPVLVSLKVAGKSAAAFVSWITIVLSLTVAISLAVEEFLRFGERWRHYRRTVEILKNDGWQFFQLSGPYKSHPSHQEAYPEFAAHVEGILQGEVEVYITQIMRERKGKEEEQPAEPPSSGES
ncbi:MAG: DUF4231 domain-containing protein [Syntrophobacterales bacterium]|jgi:hypothetical protein